MASDDGHPDPMIPPGPLLHERARSYWQVCTNSRLAAAEFYERQAAALRDLLGSIPAGDSALDLGCGDGYFTLILAERHASVRGVDLSGALITQARTLARTQAGTQARTLADSDPAAAATRVTFDTGDVETVEAAPVDLLACMGVLSGIIDPDAFERMLDRFQQLVRPGGHLLTKDTLGYVDDITNITGAYCALYRARPRYLDAVAARGFALRQEVILHDGAPSTRNSLFLFQRQPN